MPSDGKMLKIQLNMLVYYKADVIVI